MYNMDKGDPESKCSLIKSKMIPGIVIETLIIMAPKRRKSFSTTTKAAYI